MYDANLVLQAQVTKTATFNSTGVDLKQTPRRGMVARFLISAYGSGATAGAVFRPEIHESDDNTAFTLLAAAPPVTGETAAAAKEAFVPFSTIKRYVRSTMTITSTTDHTPSAAYLVDLGNARP